MQKTAYELRISDWRSDGGSSDFGELLIVDAALVDIDRNRPAEPVVEEGIGIERGNVRTDAAARLLVIRAFDGHRDAALADRQRPDRLHVDRRGEPAFQHVGGRRLVDVDLAREVRGQHLEIERSEEHTSEL